MSYPQYNVGTGNRELVVHANGSRIGTWYQISVQQRSSAVLDPSEERNWFPAVTFAFVEVAAMSPVVDPEWNMDGTANASG